jgi:hypothetical protein
MQNEEGEKIDLYIPRKWWIFENIFFFFLRWYGDLYWLYWIQLRLTLFLFSFLLLII